jgi:fucose permease
MTKQDRQGRVIASAVFVSLFFIWGSGYETFPIFFPALLKNFGWSKARLGLMSMGFSVGFIPSVLVAGWLLDRIEARCPNEPGEDFCDACGAALAVSARARKSFSALIRLAGHLSPRISKASARRSPVR